MDSDALIRPQRGWKAMILAAGFGTRLRPYTRHTPKPLFTIAGRPVIDRTIRYLVAAGCGEILINTHHLHHRIDAYIAAREFPIPVQTRYEPEILGTGGGIKNAADFFDDRPFVVVNSDIVTDIPLEKVYEFHCAHSNAVTLVLVDDPGINSVQVNSRSRVLGFGKDPDRTQQATCRYLTFTGIQVLNPTVLAHIPDRGFSSSIDTYRQIIRNDSAVRAYVAEHCKWRDIGTPETYHKEAMEALTLQAFHTAFNERIPVDSIHRIRLEGDGSDRSWYRTTADKQTLIMVDHGIRQGRGPLEVDAFIDIGRHLYRQQVAVPEIVAWDRFAGMVFIKDLGDKHLQAEVRDTTDPDQIIEIYHRVIDGWIRLAIDGNIGFDRNWTFQTRRYNRRLILEKECRYFVDAFLNGYLGMTGADTACEPEFVYLADQATTHAVDGLIHRDCQSRNIMVKAGRFYFIDFQGARSGPVQYDLASLLIDPYVELPPEIQAHLLRYAVERLSQKISIDPGQFITGYRYCALSRNLQMLGAFGYLTRVKKKIRFEAYIPAAARTLCRILNTFRPDEFPALKSVADCIKKETIKT